MNSAWVRIGKSVGVDERTKTIWEIPDHLWEDCAWISQPQADAGRHHLPDASGCQWNRLPRELGDDSTIHRTFQHWSWECSGVLNGVDWEWQSADCSMGKARLGGAPRDRGKAGSEHPGRRGGLSVAVAGANVHDTKLLRPTLESKSNRLDDRPQSPHKRGEARWGDTNNWLPMRTRTTSINSTDYCFEPSSKPL